MWSWLRRTVGRVADPVLRRGREARLDEELRVHLAMLEEDLRGSGLTPEAARGRARAILGGVDQTRESVRDEWTWPWIEHLVQDLRFSLRTMRRRPAFTTLAVVTLALAIGVNVGIFSILDAVRFRPLPVPDPQRLLQVIAVRDTGWQSNLDYEAFALMRAPHRSLAGVCAYQETSGKVRTDTGTEGVRVQGVSGNYFPLLRFRARLGRTLTERDDIASAPPAALVSDRFWRTRLNGDPAVLGQTIFVDDRPLAIVGVMGPEFFGADLARPPDVVVPFAQVPDITRNSVQVMARLAPGAPLDQARSELEPGFREYLSQLAPRLAHWTPRDRRSELSQRASVRPAPTGMGDGSLGLTPALLVLVSLAVLVLLAGCANLSGLLLAHSASRTREFSLRLSLGASRTRVLGQALVEVLLIAAIAGAAALVVSRWTQQALLSLLAPDTAALSIRYRIDVRLLAVTFGVTVLSALLVGLVPALRAARSDLYHAMREGHVARGRSRPLRALERILLTQVALAMVLVVGAGLFVGTLRNLSAVDPGFEGHSLLLAQVDLSKHQGADSGLASLETELLQRVASLPGVVSAALAANDVFGAGWNTTVWVQGYRYETSEDQSCSFNIVTGGFFSTTGTPLVAGRDFTERDWREAPPVAVINQTMARKYFGGESPIGRRFGTRGRDSSGQIEIVGVVADSRTGSLRNTARPMYYLPLLQVEQTGSVVLHVRTAGDPAGAAPRVRGALREFDQSLAAGTMTTVSAQIDDTLRRERMMALLGSAFAGLTLALVCVGLYGAASGEVGRRAKEIGLRLALGARRSDIARGVIRSALGLAAKGLAVGLPASLAAGRLVRTMLFGIGASNVPTLAAAMVLLAAVAVVAAVVPAARAASLDPMTVLRHE